MHGVAVRRSATPRCYQQQNNGWMYGEPRQCFQMLKAAASSAAPPPPPHTTVSRSDRSLTVEKSIYTFLSVVILFSRIYVGNARCRCFNTRSNKHAPSERSPTLQVNESAHCTGTRREKCISLPRTVKPSIMITPGNITFSLQPTHRVVIEHALMLHLGVFKSFGNVREEHLSCSENSV